ncbi:phosphoribosylformylglycinamidine cyclo-ligase [Mangrovibacillus cuniculi]|uniref:Phosphoribosylformylglycinamidine cyclo-ligase n=1 Tax=Mangrovibacillus cuniculi TaxID=2593652 RepID=A0A7S8C8Q6_9BACI|nr:phosphoribosylformylglycinamidine cyclo-ligase [Mangrovibacillus cuniculi]QPC45490.1 phosphoribosylformylglycinamidine cyclo-ligase [Mangrovibacillus cuniculi]
MSKRYADAGVSLEAGYETVSRIQKHVQKTNRPGVMGMIGGFGGAFDLSSLQVKEPMLVSGTDGVGTKLMLAFQTGRHDTIGIDCVAMCVNDIVAQGAEPLYFLDYLACGKADPVLLEQVVKGVADGCVQAGSALIGGETAEMPGMYPEGEYDLAGFAVGVCEKSEYITGETIAEGDVLIGLPSSGLHSNGFSLVRQIVKGMDLEMEVPALGMTLGEALLTPTEIYVKTVLPLVRKGYVKGMAHITGGGFIENIPRMMPAGVGAKVDVDSWRVPPIFTWLEEVGSLEREEMYSVFNMGIGMVLAVDPKSVLSILAQVPEAVVMGEVTATEGVTLENSLVL